MEGDDEEENEREEDAEDDDDYDYFSDDDEDTDAENDDHPESQGDGEEDQSLALEKAGERQRTAAGRQRKLALRAAKRTLRARRELLISNLFVELQGHSLGAGRESRTLVSYLVRVGQTRKALEAFLERRSQDIRLHVRQIRFQGDVAAYSQQLAHVVFPSVGTALQDCSVVCKQMRKT